MPRETPIAAKIIVDLNVACDVVAGDGVVQELVAVEDDDDVSVVCNWEEVDNDDSVVGTQEEGDDDVSER